MFDGTETRAETINAYEPTEKQVLRHNSTQQPTRVLVDPASPQPIAWIDGLAVA